jgi:hypothetical protein
MDNAALELVKGVYLPAYFSSHFPPLDIDVKTGRVHGYNFSFAVDMLRKKKERYCHVDPEFSDIVAKATILFKFNSGTTGASLQALLGKTTELSNWPDVLNATRIFRHICAGFVNPLLDTHLALLITHIEDLRVIYPGIPLNRWVHILHKKLASIREVSGMMATNHTKDLDNILSDLFTIDHKSEEFREAALHTSFGVRARQEANSSSPPPYEETAKYCCFKSWFGHSVQSYIRKGTKKYSTLAPNASGPVSKFSLAMQSCTMF